jgi:hypothetical protein
LVVSEPIGLEVVAFNGGSYTGAIIFTGWMYIGAAVCLWLVRAWKIGEIEEKEAANSKKGTNAVAAGIGKVREMPEGIQKSPFMKRMFMWRKV